MGSCCFRFLKCLFLSLNIFLFILGAGMFGLGIWILTTKSIFIPFLQSLISSFNKLVYIFIAVGAFTMILALCGIAGVFWGMRYALVLYIPLLILIFLFHFFPGLFLYLQQKMIEQNISKSIIGLIHTYNPTDKTKETKEMAWDYVQFQLSCCGWTGLENWRNNTFFQGKAGTYPCSCSNHITSFQTALGICTLGTVSHKAALDDWPVKKQGCGKVVQKGFRKAIDTILLISTIVALTEILGVSLSLFFCVGRKCVC